MDGFSYEQTFGGWHVCDICSARVTNPIKHTAWHEGLTQTLFGLAVRAGLISLAWNKAPYADRRIDD